jgi:arylformamidase
MAEAMTMGADDIVWNGFTRAALDAAYNNTVAVAHSGETLARLTAHSVGTRAQHGVGLDLPYGEKPRQRFDLLRSGQTGAPLFVFIHGGYWQRNEKAMFSTIAEGPLARGFDVALIGYTLAPEASLTEIVAECRTAIRALCAIAPGLGVPAKKIIVGGWSAGGHLAARMLEMPEVDGAFAISGIFDLEPLRHCYLQEKLGLSAEEVSSESPVHRLAEAGKPMALIVGGAELPELRRQSADYAAMRAALGFGTTFGVIEGLNHFSILDDLASPDGASTRLLAALYGPNAG